MGIRPLLLFLFVQSICKSQEFAITNHKQNIFYVGVSNPITVAANKYECKNVKLVVSYGEVQKSEDEPCNYTIVPEKPGKILLSLYVKATNTLIGTAEYRVRYLPEPLFYLAGKNKGEIKKDILIELLGIVADHFPGVDIDARFVIAQYAIAIQRNDSTIFVKQVIGAYFDNEIKAAFKKLKAGDKLTLYDITGKGIDNVVRTLSPGEFTIVE